MVKVHLSSVVRTPLDLLRDGQRDATMIFARIHVQLMWTGQTQRASKPATSCVSEPATNDLAVEIVPHAPAGFRHIALAMALPYADSAVQIVIF